MEESTIAIGNRVQCEGHFGIVKYVGIVPPTEGVWLGVEWDEPSRGKHDGSHGGVRYFRTLHPTSGSFVRPRKVSVGKTFLQAVKNRYGQAMSKQEMYIGSEKARKVVELVGFEKLADKQSHFANLKVVDLIDAQIESAGPEGEIANTTPNLTNMVLAKNWLDNWKTVAQITEQLHQLMYLNLSENKLEVPENPSELREAFVGLQEILLNKVDYDWKQVLACAEMWPNIRSLSIYGNRVTAMTAIPGNVLQNLETLDLSENNLKSWWDVCILGRLPKLANLQMAKSELTEIRFDGTAHPNKTQLFPSLKYLTIHKNHIHEWRSVNELDKLPSLQHLFILDNPIMESLNNLETIRQVFIAKIGGLVVLNRMSITDKERRGAEIDYLKRFGKEWFEAKKSDELMEAFVLKHPRYEILVDKHGPPEEGEFKETSTCLKSKLINVFISQEGTDLIMKKRVPSGMTVQKLKGLAIKLFKLNPAEWELFTMSGNDPAAKSIILDNDLRQISFYSIQEGDHVELRRIKVATKSGSGTAAKSASGVSTSTTSSTASAKSQRSTESNKSQRSTGSNKSVRSTSSSKHM